MYTRGLRDEGAQCHRGLALRPWGIPAPAGDVVRDQTPLGWHRGARRCHPSEEKPVPPPALLTGRGCSRGCRCSPSADEEHQ